mmetsp:Transcript_944/g.2883  ORF Transcript_944/g.2883 Transcript_944/m.2883 type:complete len:177 (+) Transcript_944:211-741(+)
MARALLIGVVIALAGAEGPVGMKKDVFAAVRADDPHGVAAALEEDAAALDATGPGGQSPLMHAVLQGKLLAAEALLKRGADVTIAEKDGYTPMHGAGFQGRAKIAKLLFEHGVALDDVHADGHRPIQRACWGREKRHAETVRVMLDLGAALDADECQTRNPWLRAVLDEAFNKEDL